MIWSAKLLVAMCGIVGFTGRKDKKLLQKMLRVIQHRGYDESVEFSGLGVNLGMNRLAINDLGKGYYPMRYGSLLLVFNGEIYNYLELKRELAKQGIGLKTKCDAEVILPLFNQHGTNALTMLEGMFALCIFDKKKKQLLLARDKSGEKPLYYSFTKEFLFSSEIKNLMSEFSKIEKSSLYQYLWQGFSFGDKTLVEGVCKLPPAHFLIFDLQTRQLRQEQYWGITRGKDRRESLGTLKKELSQKLEAAVEKRLLADVPVGCFLSGGVDSSLVTYFASQKINNLKTFAVSFPGYQADDESCFSREVAELLGTDHQVIECDAQKAREVIKDLGRMIDEPIVDPAVIPTFLLAREARKKVKVVLTGEGADELFGGYIHYPKELLASRIRRNKALLTGALFVRDFFRIKRLEKICTPIPQHYQTHYVWSREEISRVLRGKVSPGGKDLREVFNCWPKNQLLSAMQEIDLQGYLAEQLLMKVDKMAMINNLESRAPFLDSAVVDFAFELPERLKVHGLTGKYLLRKCAQQYLPQSLVWRKKHGFSVPLGEWFREDLKDLVYETLDRLNSFNMLFDVDYCRKVVDNHLTGKENQGEKIWSLIVLTQWLDFHKIKID